MLTVPEMMNGSRDLFDYALCPECGCLQLVAQPDDLSRYYDGYFGRGPIDPKSLDYRLQRLRYRTASGQHRNLIGRALNRYFPNSGAASILAVVERRHNVLDVGCANGLALYLMREDGYEAGIGCDPYIDKSISYSNGVVIHKELLEDRSGQYDVVMANHVLEHIPDQATFVGLLADRLAPAGTLLIRIPTCSSWAFESFREHWYQIDAPRHLYVHSRTSIRRLLKSAGLVDISISDDSTFWQLVSSRLYEQGIPFSQHLRWYTRHLPRIVVSGEFRRLTRTVERLNREGRGDQICVLAKRATAE